MIRFHTSIGACMLFLLSVSGVFAHHSFAPYYDRSKFLEVEGVITEVLWQNPHIRFTLQGTDTSGQEREWDLQTNSIANRGCYGMQYKSNITNHLSSSKQSNPLFPMDINMASLYQLI